MDNIKAEKIIRELLRTQFRYIYKETNIGPHRMHLTFKMDSRIYELQMSFDFMEKYCDVITFISPTVVTDEYVDSTIYTINAINLYVKSFGRFYLDECMDIAYAVRLPYSMIEQTPIQALSQIEAAVNFYEDLFCILLDVAQGKKTFEECKMFIDEMWK